MQKKSFYFYERWLNFFGLYNFFKKLIDTQWIKHPYYNSDLYKFSTGQFLIKHFHGYNGHHVNHQTGNIGFGFLHYAFIIAKKPERVLCIGSEQGFIPAICALACKENNKGHVDFVDANKTNEQTNHWGGKGFWGNNDPQKHFSAFELEEWLTPHITTSKQFADNNQARYEYIFIDADHSYSGVKFDYETFWPRLATGGMMGFHDINLKGLNGQDEYGVWKLWEELPKKHKIFFEYLDNSVGFIQKNT